MLSRRIVSRGLTGLRRFAAAAKPAADKGADASALSHTDITKMFLDMDASASAVSSTDLPMKLTGRSGELVGQIYGKTLKSKSFDKAVKELEGVVTAVESAGLVVDRFFTTTNYSPEECQLVVDMLLTNKEPLTSFETIKSADVKDLLVDNASNMDTWRNARKAVQALNLSEEVKSAIQSLAEEGRLDLVKKMASKAGELRAVSSKSTDATVTSAVPLSKEQQATLTKALPAYAPAGTSLNVNFTVDPAVLGGLLVSIRNTTIDLTATSRLVDVVAGSRAQLH